jgi:hypothetical protein
MKEEQKWNMGVPDPSSFKIDSKIGLLSKCVEHTTGEWYMVGEDASVGTSHRGYLINTFAFKVNEEVEKLNTPYYSCTEEEEDE